MISKNGVLTNFCVAMIPDDLKKIYFELSIVLNDNMNKNNIIEILDFDNHIYFKIFEK